MRGYSAQDLSGAFGARDSVFAAQVCAAGGLMGVERRRVGLGVPEQRGDNAERGCFPGSPCGVWDAHLVMLGSLRIHARVLCTRARVVLHTDASLQMFR